MPPLNLHIPNPGAFLNKLATAAADVWHRVETLPDAPIAAGRGEIDTFERNRGTRGPETTYTFPSSSDRARNFRDLGVSTTGARTADGKSLVSGRIFRMDAPTETDLTRLQALGVKTEIDLRSNLETGFESIRGNSPSWRGKAIAYDHFSVGPTDAYDTTSNDRDRAIAQSLVAMAQGSPVLIHCTHGVDRTGMTIATLMQALGFSRAAARDEYLRSTASPEGYGASGANFDEAWKDNDLVYRSFAGYLAHLHDLVPAFDATATVAALRSQLLH